MLFRNHKFRPGELGVRDADMLTTMAYELRRILNLNCAPPLKLIPSYDSYSLLVDLLNDSVRVRFVSDGTQFAGYTLTGATISLAGALPADPDGVTVAVGDTFLFRDGTSSAHNDIYQVGALNPFSASRVGPYIPGMVVLVQEGDEAGCSIWKLNTAAPITPGTTPLVYEHKAGGKPREYSLTADQASLPHPPTNYLAVAPNAHNYQVRSFAPPISGRYQGMPLRVRNDGNYPAIIPHEYTTGTTAANRVQTPDALDLYIDPKTEVLLNYDTARQRYVVMARTPLPAQPGAALAVAGGGSRVAVSDLDAYWKLAGRAGGQTGYGGTAASEGAIIGSTAHATKGYVQLQDILQLSQAEATLSATENNYALAKKAVLHLIPASGGSTITGLSSTLASTGSGFARQVTIYNVSTSTDVLTLAHNSGSSTAANRVYCPYARDLAIAPGEGAVVSYYPDLSHWTAAPLGPLSSSGAKIKRGGTTFAIAPGAASDVTFTATDYDTAAYTATASTFTIPATGIYQVGFAYRYIVDSFSAGGFRLTTYIQRTSDNANLAHHQLWGWWDAATGSTGPQGTVHFSTQLALTAGWLLKLNIDNNSSSGTWDFDFGTFEEVNDLGHGFWINRVR